MKFEIFTIFTLTISDGSTDLLLAVYKPIKLMKEYPCELTSVPVDYRKLGNGLLFQKNWSYTKLINYHLFKVHKQINSMFSLV